MIGTKKAFKIAESEVPYSALAEMESDIAPPPRRRKPLPAHWAWRTVGGHMGKVNQSSRMRLCGVKPNPNYDSRDNDARIYEG